ncbi:hypothetical protein IKG45_02845 [Candidatus Saccharibacteria bacterium]|nr:hypothetical protein [Candidatus Saccharibacteria bacterium]
MKKRNKLTLILTALFFAFSLTPFFSVSTYADISAPYVYEYDVIVTKQGGAQLLESRYDQEKNKIVYDEVITVPEKTRLTVVYDFSSADGEKMMSVEYEGRNYLIRASDVGYADDTFDLSTISKASSPLSVYTVNDESYLYKGPNERFGKVDGEYHLPAGIIVSADYYDGLWMYVEYEGHSGWIKHMHAWVGDRNTASIATDKWNRTFVTTRDKIDLKDAPNEDGKTIATLDVKPLTEIPVLYYIPSGKFSTYVYVSYGQYSGWYHKDSTTYDVAFQTENASEGVTIKETKITSVVDSESDSSTIPANTEFNVLYTASKGWYGQDGTKAYIRTKSNNNQFSEGWIDGKGYATGTYKDGKYTEKVLNYDQPIFDSVDGKETGEYAKAGAYEILYYYTKASGDQENTNTETWYYLGKQKKNSYDHEIVGWIKDLSNDEIKELEKAKREELEKQMENEDPDDLVLYKIPDEIDPKATMIPTIIWFLVGSIVVSISIIVALAIAKHIKKSKETDDSEPKTDEKSEENEPKSEKSDDETKEEPEEEAGENSENREEKEKKEDLKSEKTDDEIEENFDEFLDENSPKSEEKGDGFEPDSEKEPEETKPKSKKAKLEDKEKGEKDA